jgi:CheY-like chemotaxis protein
MTGAITSEEARARDGLAAATKAFTSELSLTLVRIWLRSGETEQGVAIACAAPPQDSAGAGGLTPEAAADALRLALPEPERSTLLRFDGRFRGPIAAPCYLGATLFRKAAAVAYLEAYSENPVELPEFAKAREGLTRFFLSADAYGIPTGSIVVAEDDDTTRLILGRMLRRHHYRVIDVENGHLACNAVRKEQPDLVLMDWAMPVMDGREATIFLKADRATRAIPIVMLTSHSAIEDKLAALEAGVQDFITKPFDEFDLIARIDGHMLWRSRLREASGTQQPPASSVTLELPSGLMPSETEIPAGVVPSGDMVWLRAVQAANVGNIAEATRLFLAEAEVCDADHRTMRAAVAYRSASLAAAEQPNMPLANRLMVLAGKMFATAAESQTSEGPKQQSYVNAARCFLACNELALAKHALDAALAV